VQGPGWLATPSLIGRGLARRNEIEQLKLSLRKLQARLILFVRPCIASVAALVQAHVPYAPDRPLSLDYACVQLTAEYTVHSTEFIARLLAFAPCERTMTKAHAH
jgi:hypothetical protein